MNLTLTLTLLSVVVAFFVFVLGHLVLRFASRFVQLTGVEFLVVGVLIGPHYAWGLVTADSLARLNPLVSLLLGLAAFMLGLRFRKALERVDATGAGFTSTLITIVLSSAVLLVSLVAVLPDSAGHHSEWTRGDFAVDRTLWRVGEYLIEVHFTSTQLWLAIALGCAASVTSTRVIDVVRRELGSSGPATRLITTSGTMAQVVSVFVLGLTMSTARTDTPFRLSIIEWALATIGAGVVFGLLFGLFLGRERDPSRIFLATVGLVTFASGVGATFGIAPLFVNLLAGVTVSATSPNAEQVRDQLDRLHDPLFGLMMLFAGAEWSAPAPLLWIVPLVYLVVRILARSVTTPFTASIFLETVPSARRLGAGFLSQGMMAVAIGLYATQRFPEHKALILTTVLGGLLVSDLLSRRALRNVLIDAGEAGQAEPPARADHTRPDDEVPSDAHVPESRG